MSYSIEREIVQYILDYNVKICTTKYTIVKTKFGLAKEIGP